MPRTKQFKAEMAYRVELTLPDEKVLADSVVLREALEENETDLLWHAITQAELDGQDDGTLHLYLHGVDTDEETYEIYYQELSPESMSARESAYLMKVPYKCTERKYNVDPVGLSPEGDAEE